MTKRFLSALLAVLMVISLIPVAAFAVEEATEVTVDQDGTVTLSGGSYKISSTLTADITVTGTVDLAISGSLTNKAGHTITVNEGANLTITGTGTVDNTKNGVAALLNDKGTVTLNGCTFKRSGESSEGSSPTESAGNSWYTIVNAGTMTIGGETTVQNQGHYSSMIKNGYNGKGTLTINGGNFSGGINTLKNDSGKITINNGTFSNTTQSVIMNWDETIINNGTFNMSVENMWIVLSCYNKDGRDDGSNTAKGSVEINGGEFTVSGNVKPIELKTYDPALNDGKGAWEAANSKATATITGGTFNSDPFAQGTGVTSTTHVAVQGEGGKYVVVSKDNIKDELITAIQTAMAADTAGAPLNDTREAPDKVTDLVKDGTYNVVVAETPVSGSDLTLNVTAKELKAHQNGATPASMGYWVGVKFPVIPDWTITKYKRDSKAEVTDISLDTDENDKQTFNAYYNVGDTSTEVDDPRVRPVEVTYTKGGVPVTVKFIVNLKNVEIMVPAKAPESDGSLSENTQKELTDAITAAATGGSKNDEDTGEADKTTPTVSVETATSGSVTINKEIVEALKGAAEDTEKKNVDLKIVGNDGAEATIPASTAKELDSSKDLVPTVKADTTGDANVPVNSITEETTKNIVNNALTTLGTEGKYVVTVTLKQNNQPIFTEAGDCEITVKVPVPDESYDTIVHVTDDGKVTKESATQVKEGDKVFLKAKITHLSYMFGGKSSELEGIGAEPVIVPTVTFVEPTDSTPDKNWYFPNSGELTITNSTGRDRTYLIGLSKINYGDNQSVFVQTITEGQSWKVRCHKDMKLYLLELTSDVDLSSDNLPEDTIYKWSPMSNFK